MKTNKHWRQRSLLWTLIAVAAFGIAACAFVPLSSSTAPEPTPQILVTFYPPAATPTTEPAGSTKPLLTQIQQPSPTLVPTPMPSPVPPTPLPLPYMPPGPSALLTGLRHIHQTWNNCGPATIAMQLSYFGRTESQRDAALFLKPDPDDKNVSPDELVAYARSLNFEARAIVGGNLDLLKTLVANGFPVIVETWFIPKPNDEMGHYQLLIGYEGDTFTFYDSYEGPNWQEAAQQFDPLWKVFNRVAIVIWPAEQTQLVQTILDDHIGSDDRTMHGRALAAAQAELAQNPQDKFAWFNVGTNLLALGNSAEAAQAFDKARELKLPWRMFWYQFGPYAAYFEQGRYDAVIQLATATLRPVKNLEESLYWRGRAYLATGNADAARADFELALKFNPNYYEASEALGSM